MLRTNLAPTLLDTSPNHYQRSEAVAAVVDGGLETSERVNKIANLRETRPGFSYLIEEIELPKCSG